MTEDVDYRIKAIATGASVTLHVVIKLATILMRLLSPVSRPQVERNFAANVARFERLLNVLPGPPAPAPSPTWRRLPRTALQQEIWWAGGRNANQEIVLAGPRCQSPAEDRRNTIRPP